MRGHPPVYTGWFRTDCENIVKEKEACYLETKIRENKQMRSIVYVCACIHSNINNWFLLSTDLLRKQK